MWPLWDSALNEDVPLKYKIAYLSLVNDVYNLDSVDISGKNNMKDVIQKKISQSTTRIEGLLLFETAVQRNLEVCPSNWEPVIEACLAEDSIVLNKLGFNILKHYLSKSEILKKGFAVCLPKVIQVILKMDEKNSLLLPACQCLALSLLKLPELMMPFKNDIEKFLLNQMDNLSSDITDAVAESFALLPTLEVHNKKVQFAEREKWTAFTQRVINTMKHYLQSLNFMDVTDNASAKENACIFEIIYSCQDEFSNSLIQMRIFATLCKCLIKLISCTRRKLAVPMYELLHCLDRTFHLSGIEKKKHTLSSQVVYFGYPIMQNAALLLLETLIMCSDFYEDSRSMLNIIKKSLDVSKEFHHRHFSARQPRCTIWRVLNAWLMKFNYKGSLDPDSQNTFVDELLNDVQTEASKLENSSLDDFIPETDSIALKNKSAVCAAALKALDNMIFVCAPSIEKCTGEKISSTIIRVAKGFKNEEASPYIETECRKYLYKVMLSISFYLFPCNMSWLLKAIGVFNVAQRDADVVVAYSCQKSLSLCRFLIHQKKPPPHAVAQLVTEEEDSQEAMVKQFEGSWPTVLSEDVRLPDGLHTGAGNGFRSLQNSTSRNDAPRKVMYRPSARPVELDQQCNGSSELSIGMDMNEEDVVDEEEFVDENDPIYSDLNDRAVVPNTVDTVVENRSIAESVEYAMDEDVSGGEEEAPAAREDADDSDESVEEETVLPDVQNLEAPVTDDAKPPQAMQENGLDSSSDSQSLHLEEEEGEDEEEAASGEEADNEEAEEQQEGRDEDEQPAKRQRVAEEEAVVEEPVPVPVAEPVPAPEKRSESPTVADIVSSICFDPPLKKE